MIVLSIVQSAGLGNNLSKPNQYTEIEYLGQYSVCKFFLILSQWIMWALLQKMRGRQGGIPFTLPPPKTGPGVKGYLGPVVVFMGIRINADRTLRRAANAFGVKF